MCTSFANNSLTCVLLTFGSSMNITSTASQNFESDRWDRKVSPLICISQWHCYGQAFFYQSMALPWTGFLSR